VLLDNPVELTLILCAQDLVDHLHGHLFLFIFGQFGRPLNHGLIVIDLNQPSASVELLLVDWLLSSMVSPSSPHFEREDVAFD
jgi:hypothetical protein